MAQVLTNENFKEEVLNADRLVLIDFWAEWCGPCRSIAPTINALEEEFGDRVLIAKVNVDEQPEIAEAYHVSSIPTIFIFEEGEIVERLIGAHPIEEYREALNKHL